MKIKVYPHVVGNTLGSHETFLKRIKKRGAKITKTQDESDETIVFCPIASRFETDVQSALSTISGKYAKNPNMELQYKIKQDILLFLNFFWCLTFCFCISKITAEWFWWRCTILLTRTTLYLNGGRMTALKSNSLWSVCFMRRRVFTNANATATQRRVSTKR